MIQIVALVIATLNLASMIGAAVFTLSILKRMNIIEATVIRDVLETGNAQEILDSKKRLQRMKGIAAIVAFPAFVVVLIGTIWTHVSTPVAVASVAAAVILTIGVISLVSIKYEL